MSKNIPQSKLMMGRPAPHFIAHSTKGMIDLAAYEGSWVLLFCHPADFTPVCTTEFISLAKQQHRFDALGVELVGLSVDSVYSHLSWIDWIEDNFGQKVSFPVIEDSSLQIAKVYGMIDETSVNTSTVRSCVFIDPTQTVQAVIHYPMQVGRSATRSPPADFSRGATSRRVTKKATKMAENGLALSPVIADSRPSAPFRISSRWSYARSI